MNLILIFYFILKYGGTCIGGEVSNETVVLRRWEV